MHRLVTAALVLLATSVEAQAASRCASVESPAALGIPVVLMPAGVVPHTGPLEIADLARGDRKDRVVTCVELSATAPARASEDEPVLSWVVHLEAPFFTIVRGAHGSCRASHQLLTFDDRTARLESRVGIDRRCRMRPYEFLRGR
jgi:hypothetical protein